MFLIRTGPFAICTVGSALIPALHQKPKERCPFQSSRFPDQKNGLPGIFYTPPETTFLGSNPPHPKILFGFTTANRLDQ